VGLYLLWKTEHCCPGNQHLPGVAKDRGIVVTDGIAVGAAVDDAHRSDVQVAERAGVNIG
jgi:hypothetical protein